MFGAVQLVWCFVTLHKNCSHYRSSRKTAVTAVCRSSCQRTGHKDGMVGTSFSSNSCYNV